MADYEFPSHDIDASPSEDVVESMTEEFEWRKDAKVLVMIDRVGGGDSKKDGAGLMFFDLIVLNPEDPDKRVSGPRLSSMAGLPIDNPNTGFKITRDHWSVKYRGWETHCRAFLSDKHPRLPFKKGSKYYFEGEEMSLEDGAAKRSELADAIIEEAYLVGGKGDEPGHQGSDFKNQVAVATIGYKTNADTGEVELNMKGFKPPTEKNMEGLTPVDKLLVKA